MDKIWLTWHYSQRSRNIANDFDVELWEYVNNNSSVERHLFSSLKTIFILLKYKPSIIFLQCSFMLLNIVALYKLLVNKRVIVICDCHTKAIRRRLCGFLGTIFNNFKEISFKCTNVCIISNDLMISDIIRYTSEYFILPDKIPDFDARNEGKFDNYCVFVGAYAVDEPLNEVIMAAGILKSEPKIYCTGKIPERLKYIRNQPYEHIFFTDYLPDEEYLRLIANAQCILALTTEEGCLQCAGYEALALQVPLIVSDTAALRTYFNNSAIYVANDYISIVDGIRMAIRESEKIKCNMSIIRELRRKEYAEKIHELKKLISSLHTQYDVI